MKIKNHPILKFDEGKIINFYFDGKQYQGIEGQPIAVALIAQGIHTFGHSHDGRPRGIYCAIGNCSSCLATVNNKPNVRLCVEPLAENMSVVSQNGRGVLK